MFHIPNSNNSMSSQCLHRQFISIQFDLIQFNVYIVSTEALQRLRQLSFPSSWLDACILGSSGCVSWRMIRIIATIVTIATIETTYLEIRAVGHEGWAEGILQALHARREGWDAVQASDKAVLRVCVIVCVCACMCVCVVCVCVCVCLCVCVLCVCVLCVCECMCVCLCVCVYVCVCVCVCVCKCTCVWTLSSAPFQLKRPSSTRQCLAHVYSWKRH